jgi:hypothetical protein
VTEAEWLTSDDPVRMCADLGRQVDRRKSCLFACALLRSERDHLNEEEAATFDRFEAQADGREVKPVERPSLSPVDAFRLRGATSLLKAQLEFWSGFLGYSGTLRGGTAVDPSRARLLREVFGNPFRPAQINPAWRTPTVRALATAAYEERELPRGHLQAARLAVLSDALEEAGCTDGDLLAHLRSPGPHVRGCWPLDLILSHYS